MLISLSAVEGVESNSATKAVIASSKLVFGTKGEAIVKRMEELVKIKELDTAKIDYVLDQIKTSTDADLQKWKATASGKATITGVRALVSAKSLVQVINALRSIKVPRAATQTGLKGTSTPVAKTKTPVKGGLSIHTFQQMYELFQRDDNDEYKCAKRIAKMAGVAKIPKSAIGGWTGNEDNEELYFFAPQANGPVDAVVISETSSMARSLKDLKGKGGVTVAVVHVRGHIENLLYGNARTRKATQLGKFANFEDAMVAFLGAIPTVLTAKRPAAKTSTKAIKAKMPKNYTIAELRRMTHTQRVAFTKTLNKVLGLDSLVYGIDNRGESFKSKPGEEWEMEGHIGGSNVFITFDGPYENEQTGKWSVSMNDIDDGEQESFTANDFDDMRSFIHKNKK